MSKLLLTKWYKHLKDKKLSLNSQLQTYQILTNDDQMFILCLSYFVTAVLKVFSFSLVFSSFQFNIPIGVEDDDEDNKSAPLSANATPNHTYNSMQTGGTIEATIPPGNVPADKSIAAKAWSGFDAKYMKPLLTHSNPTLMETLPDCCGEYLGFLNVI